MENKSLMPNPALQKLYLGFYHFLCASGALLAISACGFRYVIQGLLSASLEGFHSSEPQNFVGSAEPMEPTLTRPLVSIPVERQAHTVPHFKATVNDKVG